MTSSTKSIRTEANCSALGHLMAASAINLLPAGLTDFAKLAIHLAPAISSGVRSRVNPARKPAECDRLGAERLRNTVELRSEEHLNTITHALGFALATAGFVYLLTSVVGSSWLCMASCAVYGTSLMSMYLASTLLHSARTPRLKLRFQLLDHVAIYLLIAGTYTPLLAVRIQGYAGFTLLACVWLLAALGISIKMKNAERLEDTSPFPCVGLGWLGLVAIKPLVAVLPATGMALLLAGGLSFSAGVFFYCRDDKRYFHVIWHLFVMVGTALHFGAILVSIDT